MKLPWHLLLLLTTSAPTSQSYLLQPPKPFKTELKMSLLVTGLNSALQKRFYTTELLPGNVHRATKIQYDIGGKGQNCISTLSNLSSTSTKDKINLLQFVGKGENGDKLLNMLKEKKNVNFLTVRPDSETRVCTTIISTNDDISTEFVEPSCIVNDNDVKSLLRLVNKNYNGILFMGSLPTSCPIDIYSQILQLCFDTLQNYKILVIDTVHGLPELFQTIYSNGTNVSVKAMLKINMAELFRLLGVDGKDNEIEELDNVVPLLHDAVQKFRNQYLSHDSINISLAITDGKHPAYFIQYNNTNYTIHQIKIPNLKEMFNTALYPIGAGDAVAASTLAAWYDLEFNDAIINDTYHSMLHHHDSNLKNKMLVAFIFGLACGSASCLQFMNSVFERDNVESLFLRIIDSDAKCVTQIV